MKTLSIDLCETNEEASIFLLSVDDLNIKRIISLFYSGSSGEIDHNGDLILYETDTHLECKIGGKSKIDFANFIKFVIAAGGGNLIFENKYLQ